MLRKGNIGFLFQEPNLIDEFTVYENIELPLTYLNLSASERKIKTLEVLNKISLAHRKNHYPQQLSGGQKQRVALARAMVANPTLLLADEPTGNLDSKNGEYILNLLSEINIEGTTVIMVTHSDVAAEKATRRLSLFDGQIVTENIKQFL